MIMKLDLSPYRADIQVLIADIGSDEIIYAKDACKVVRSASLIKVGIMCCVFDEVQKGTLSLEQKLLVKKERILPDTAYFEDGERRYSLLELVIWMIINSDNTATNVLIDILGFAKINAYFKKIGVADTSLERYMLDQKAMLAGKDNYTSQNDMYKLFRMIFQNRILNTDLCDLSISILKRQRSKDLLLRYISDDVCFAHKTGELDHLRHDVGVIKINDRYYYIGVSVYDKDHIDTDLRIIGKIGKMIYDQLKNMD